MLGQDKNAAIIQAIESNLFGHMSYFARHLPAMEVIDTPDLLIINSHLPSDTFNYVCRANLNEANLESGINFALNYFQQRQLPMTWWIGDNSKPVNLAQYLEKSGLKRTEEALGMAMDLNELPQQEFLPPGLEIRKVKNSDELEHYAHILASNWNPPDISVIKFYEQAATVAFRPDTPIHFYVGYLNREPVATSELFLGGDVAGIYGITTLEGFRKRGIGTAMTLTPLLYAYKKGYKRAILQASEEGKNIYSRLGFKPYCNFYIYQ